MKRVTGRLDLAGSRAALRISVFHRLAIELPFETAHELFQPAQLGGRSPFFRPVGSNIRASSSTGVTGGTVTWSKLAPSFLR